VLLKELPDLLVDLRVRGPEVVEAGDLDVFDFVRLALVLVPILVIDFGLKQKIFVAVDDGREVGGGFLIASFFLRTEP
jgi:hypothetical protein